MSTIVNDVREELVNIINSMTEAESAISTVAGDRCVGTQEIEELYDDWKQEKERIVSAILPIIQAEREKLAQQIIWQITLANRKTYEEAHHTDGCLNWSKEVDQKCLHLWKKHVPGRDPYDIDQEAYKGIAELQSAEGGEENGLL